MRIWIIGGCTALLGVLGLIASAHSGDGGVRGMGMALFVLSILFVLLLVKEAYDRAEGYGLEAERLAYLDARWQALCADMGPWITGGAAALLGIAGLLGASHADGTARIMGLMLFVLAILLDFVLVKHAFDKAERA